MRILHTSDWHLGHTLHDLPREHEHERFLAWLLETIADEKADALIVAGDIFDSANPPAAAQAQWYGFLARARVRFPALGIVVVGGNHDSPGRLDAPEPLLRALLVHVVGGLPRASEGSRPIDLDRLLVPLLNAEGSVTAWVMALPFLRPADLRLDELPAAAGDAIVAAARDPLVDGVRQIYEAVLAEARARRRPGQALIATGHCYMVGTEISELSERKILGGNLHALPIDLFPEDVAYAALGHLHKPQRVGQREGVRYSGSPIPLSMPEGRNTQQICVVELDGERLAEVRSRAVPRTTEILRLPTGGARPLDEILPILSSLPPFDPSRPEAERPLLEVRVLLEKPDPTLRRRLDDALDGKAARLVKLTPEFTGHGRPLAEAAGGMTSLRDLREEDVFVARYQRDHQGPVPEELLVSFRELLDEVRRGEP